MNSKLVLALAAITLSACATSGTDGPVRISEDLYMIGGLGSPLDHSGSAVKAAFFKRAAEHCASLGREMVPVGSTGRDASMSAHASAEVQYRCLKR